EGVVARLRDDYGVDLETESEAAAATPPPPDFEPDSAPAEIESIRSRIAKLGAVNVQAVEQLDETERRLTALAVQLADLDNAKAKLAEILDAINGESRRLFLETFETVRGHFQELFRKLFGGGKADLVLDAAADPLEAGIDVMARPPGKEPRSISLLSGGEKTLTAAALLMALFRSKPSPFCVLDEVDAALDEANISRFVELLRQFIADTQFVLVTHSKTTMAAADVLHGVTQRESGVSIRVTVRLEDVSDDGSLRAGGPAAQAA
ncbi:MAG TPA: AAA family ATPase, partial [Planctomycetia bacterium]|nr:AAA family ATPase [Planctomycetia bacterium]